MASGFESYHGHVHGPGVGGALEAIARPQAAMTAKAAGFANDEAAARFYLTQVLAQTEGLEGLAAVEEPAAVPDLQLVSAQPQPLTNTTVVRFQQEQAGIPVFGSKAIIELDQDRNYVSHDVEVAQISGVSPMAGLSPSQALERVGEFTGVSGNALAGVDAPQLMFFHDDDAGAWHLVYFFKEVPAAPPGFDPGQVKPGSATHSHGFGLTPRIMRPRFNYLVDAHDGAIVYYYSAQPLLDVPSKARGLDESGASVEFFGRMVQGGFAMDDPLRDIKTYDLNFGDVDHVSMPADPVTGPGADWTDTNHAAVSAHLNATRVYDFYKGELKRDSIDDKGMALVSLVNCTCAAEQPPPEWLNAFWSDNRMWYGQYRDANGKFHSLSGYLDVIAHELTHGVTETTANLVYRGQPGALNESFSDIFGIIIRNWYECGANADVGGWNWLIGNGLGQNGQPFRDMSNPERLGYPGDMDHYQNLPETWDGDWGGVHINSSIHNKAAYNVLTIGDELGERVFEPREVAILYYLTLTRLDQLATFAKTLQVLLDVARTFYAGETAERDAKVAAIQRAYGAVGIVEA